MRRASLATGALVAGGFALLAVLAHANLVAALPLATLAVAVAATVLVLAALPREPRRGAVPSGPLETNNVRAWLREGGLGHEEVVRLMDKLDRMGSHPNLGVRTEPEMDEFRRMPSAEFHAFVSQRLDDIEGEA